MPGDPNNPPFRGKPGAWKDPNDPLYGYGQQGKGGMPGTGALGPTGDPGPNEWYDVKGHGEWLYDQAGNLLNDAASQSKYKAEAQGYTPDMGESRARQGQGIDAVQNWALTGNGPSAAQALLRKGTNENVATAMAMAKAQPGGNMVAQQRMAGDQLGAALSAGANDAAALRATEQQAAMEQYQKGLQGWRQGDIDAYAALANANAQAQAQNAETARANAEGKGGLIKSIVGGVGGWLGL